jgi:L-alanine-DL-glutamate epimerase-like enolase superfamily enzyme
MPGSLTQVETPIEKIDTSVYTIPTDYPESDGTLEWDSTTIVVVEVSAGGKRGLGYTYANAATAEVIKNLLADVIAGRDAMDVPGAWWAMLRSIRNLGRPGIVSMAVAGVDNALWDLKARVLDLPLVKLLGSVRDAVPVYGSGGFTSYSIDQLQSQLSNWVMSGISMVKMKVGSHPEQDVERVRAARESIGNDAQLFVDANGAYSRTQAFWFADEFAKLDVSWFEEPVSSDDLEGLRFVRNRAPAGMDIAAGEYGYDAWYFRHMLEASAVDVLQADATRCAGITGFLNAGALCLAHNLSLSAHTAPSIHAHVGCAVPAVRHLEYFHDHVRIENMFFDGTLQPVNGQLHPDLTRPGMGLELRRSDVKRYAVSS